MQLDFAFFARAGELSREGVFSVLGGGFDRLSPPEFPATIPQLCVLLGVLLTQEESGVSHHLNVQVVSPGGEELPASGELLAAPQPAGEGERSARLTCLVNFVGVGFPEPGVYEFRVLVDSRLLGTMHLHCQLPETTAGTNTGRDGLSLTVSGQHPTAEQLEEMRLARAVRDFKLPVEWLRANLDRFKPPQSWYDEDEDLFGD